MSQYRPGIRTFPGRGDGVLPDPDLTVTVTRLQTGTPGPLPVSGKTVGEGILVRSVPERPTSHPNHTSVPKVCARLWTHLHPKSYLHTCLIPAPDISPTPKVYPCSEGPAGRTEEVPRRGRTAKSVGQGTACLRVGRRPGVSRPPGPYTLHNPETDPLFLYSDSLPRRW